MPQRQGTRKFGGPYETTPGLKRIHSPLGRWQTACLGWPGVSGRDALEGARGPRRPERVFKDRNS